MLKDKIKINNDFFNRLKDRKFTRREEILGGALILLTTGIIGYYSFIQDPVENKRAYLQAIENAKTRTVSAEEESSSLQNKKSLFKESDIVDAVNEYIQKDPYIEIVDQKYTETNPSQGILELSLKHNGNSGELSQFIEQINKAPHLIITDYLAYNQNLEGVSNSDLRVKFPYIIQDNQLKGTVFANSSPITTTPITNPTPPTTATPKKSKSSKASSSHNTSKWSRSTPSTIAKSKKSSSASTNSIKKNSKNNSSITKSKPVKKQKAKNRSSNKNISSKNSSNHSSSAKKTPTKKVKPQTEKPNKICDTENYAEPIMRYSVLDTFLNITSSESVKLNIDKSFADKKMNDLLIIHLETPLELSKNSSENIASDKKEAALDINTDSANTNDEISEETENGISTDNSTNTLETPKNIDQGRAPVNQEIRFDTGGIYLPKNSYELSFDIKLPLATKGDFVFILSNEEGHITELKEDRRHDLQDGFYRIFFKLKDMDGTIRGTQLKYKFIDKGHIEDELVMRNFQILSEE